MRAEASSLERRSHHQSPPMAADRRISVLHFSNERIRGGAEEHMLMLLRALDRRHFRLHLACPRELVDRFGGDLPPDIDVTPIDFQRPTQFSTALRFARLLRTRGIQILHSHMFHASMVASPIGRISGVPVIIETPHVREHWRNGWIKGSYFVDRMVGRFVTRFIAVSRANAEYLIRTKKLPAAKIITIQNGCDLSRFTAASRPERLRAALGFDANAPVIVVLARLEPQKGHAVLLEAMKTVRERFPEARLALVGDGELREQIQKRIAETGLQDCVRVAGYQSNVAEWLALAAFTVLPSFYEGLPLAAIESLAASRAVIATAVDGTVEVVLHEQTGLTVPPGDAPAIAAAMLRLLADPPLAEALGRNGCALVNRNFTREQQLQKTEQTYLDLAAAALHSSREAADAALAGGRAK